MQHPSTATDSASMLADRIEQRLTAATTQTERITQSVRAKAFSGQLAETEADLARRDDQMFPRETPAKATSR